MKLIRGREKFDRLDPGKIQVIQQERELDRQLYNGERSALMILDDVRVGDIIDVAYTLRGQNPVFGGKFLDTVSFEWGVPVREQRYRLLVPEDRALAFGQLPREKSSVAESRIEFQSRAHDGEMDLTWRRTNTPIVEREDRVPSSHYVFSFLDVSEFRSWAQVVEWALPLYADDPTPRPLLDALVASLRGKAAGEEQSALAALDFVQQEIRYLGIEMGPGSHHPAEPEEVLRRRFGDCKDKTRLLCAILRRLDLHAAPALVHSSHREAVRARQPSPYAFDHVVVALDVGSRRYLLDPTMSYQRGTTLDLRHVGGYGPYLRLAPENTRLENALISQSDVHHTVINTVFQVSDLEKPAMVTITTISEGGAANQQRAYFATRTLDQISREYLDYYTRYYRGITPAGIIEFRDDAAVNRFTVTERYQVRELFVRQPGSTILRAEFNPASIWDYVRMPNLAQRRQPFAISYPAQLKETITINLPGQWSIRPGQETVSDDAFVVTAQTSNPDPRTVRLEYTWTSRAFHIETARLAAFSASIDKVRTLLGYELSWNAATGRDGASFPIHWGMAALAAGILALGAGISWRLVRKTNPLPPEPPILAPDKPIDPYGYQSRKRADLHGLGGWLALVAVGLCLRPIMVLATIVQSSTGYFNRAVWNIVTTPGTEHYQSKYALVAPLELIVNFSLLAYSVLLLLLFFRRSHLFPRTIQIFLGLCIPIALFAIWDNGQIATPADPKKDFEGYKMLIQAVVGAAIWIPYFQVSVRVRHTFIR